MVLEITDYTSLLQIILAIIAVVLGGGFFGIYKILSYQLQKEAETKAHQTIKARIADLYGVIGYMYWRDYDITKDFQYLEESIEHTRFALEECQEINEKDNELLICRLKNNLASYIIYRKDNKDGDKEIVAECVNYLRSRLTYHLDKQDTWSITIKEAKEKFGID